MKLRARRFTIAAAALGAAVVGVLVVLNSHTVRDHLEAWHFQLTTQTNAITVSDPAMCRFVSIEAGLLEHLSCCSGNTVIVDAHKNYYVGTQAGNAAYSLSVAVQSERLSRSFTVTADRRDLIVEVLRSNGYRVLEQRFPRRASVVIRDKSP